MLGRQEFQPQLFATVDIEKLIPENHLLRRIDATIDLSFVRELTAHLYSAGNGRPSIDPELFFKIYLISFLYGIESDRRTCEEIQVNIAYRWFCRLNLEDAVPDHSSLSKIRDRIGESTFKEIFERIVNICFERGLCKGTRVMMDGSLLKADAALRSMVDRPKDGENLEDKIPPKYIKDRKMSNQGQVSRTDPDATLAGKKGEPKKLAYKAHNTIDRDGRIVLDTHITTGAVTEGTVMMSRLDAYEKSFKKKVEEVTADRGYGYSENLKALKDREITSWVPRFREDVGVRVMEESQDFPYNKDEDCFVCPKGHKLTPMEGPIPGYKRYRIKGGHCVSCPLKEKCFTLKSHYQRNAKFLQVHQHHDLIEEVARIEKTEDFKKMRGERQWKMEGSFAEAKENHCLGRARYRGRAKMQIQAYMIGFVLNLKRLVAAYPHLTSGINKIAKIFEKFKFCSVQKIRIVFWVYRFENVI